ncbi:MAG: ABC transporter permease, partial [Ignavibacteriales bacterium]|nr:ABC transporter permease [Ignavibacteriales bacterium]
MRGKFYQVARWEYIEKIKSKAFIISLLLTPAIMVAAGLIPSLLMSRPDTESIVIGIIDQSGIVYQPYNTALEEKYKLPNGQPNYVLRLIEGNWQENAHDVKRQADSMVINETIEGYLIIGPSIMTDTAVEYRAKKAGNIKLTSRIERVLRDLIVEMKLQKKGLDPVLVKELTAPIDMKTIKIIKEGKEEEAGFKELFFTSYIFMMMMFFLIVTSGQLLIRSMMEEKSNRVVEVLMSSSSANDLMAGKIIGLSALGLSQIGFWALIGIVISLKFGMTMIPPINALVLLIYFILGYLFYAAIFVAAGAPLTTEQEAQQVSGYLVMILIIPLILAMMVIQNPNATLVQVLTYIPFLTASMMAVRIPIQLPSIFEIIATIIILIISSVVAIWIAGKIFRTPIL